jgi:hypothetical protein
MPAQQAPVVAQTPAQKPQADAPARQVEPPRQSEPVAQQADEPPAQRTADGDELRQRVNANWDRFMAVVKSQGGVKLSAALKSVKEIETDGRILVLRFAAAHNFSREMIDEPAHKAAVEAAWRQVLGEDVGIRCSLMGSAATPAGGGKQEQPRAGGDALLEEAKRRGAVVRQLD